MLNFMLLVCNSNVNLSHTHCILQNNFNNDATNVLSQCDLQLAGSQQEASMSQKESLPIAEAMRVKTKFLLRHSLQRSTPDSELLVTSCDLPKMMKQNLSQISPLQALFQLKAFRCCEISAPFQGVQAAALHAWIIEHNCANMIAKT